MEQLLHYVWKNKIFPLPPLTTTDGQGIDVIDPGLHNTQQGPDFFNAKVKINGTLWVGNVEIHEKASDWYAHRHETDAAYNNVILHVVGEADRTVRTAAGQDVPQLVLPVPETVQRNYAELLAEEAYPPCYRVIPQIDSLTAHSWLSALTVERLSAKTQRINGWMERTQGDWERVFFVTLARNFGFGTNAEAFEIWANSIPPHTIEKHRDDAFQVEAVFFGQAGLLSNDMVPEERRDDYFLRLQREYAYLAHKFSLQPMDARQWKFLRMRPQNFPHARLAQLVTLYHRGNTRFSQLLEAKSREDFHKLFAATTTPYWETHYTFGTSSTPAHKSLRTASLDLLIINTAAPLLFAYGRSHFDESRCEQAFELLESIPPESNYITRSWAKAGISAANAADSQALIHLRNAYCNPKDCLRCRFGSAYLRKKVHPLTPYEGDK